MDKVFSYYKHLMRIIDFKINGVFISRTTTFALYRMAKGLPLEMKWYKVFNVFRAFDFGQLKFDSQHNSILTTGGLIKRNDYQEIYQYVISQLGDQASENLLFQLNRKIVFHPIIAVKLLNNIMKALRGEYVPFAEQLKYFVIAMFYSNSAYELKKINLTGVRKYLAFENAVSLENMLTQYMKMKCIETYSLAEGMYLWYPECTCIDAVHHELIETDHLICWGQYSVDEFKNAGINERRLHVGGYPHPVRIKNMKMGNRFQKCVVLLARQSFEQANRSLLSILRCFGNIHFCLKLHPTLSFAEYKDFAGKNGMDIVPKSTTINECMDNEMFDFSIAVNTTAYYEALMRGVPCLRYKHDSFKLSEGYHDFFDDRDSLSAILNAISNTPVDEYQQEVGKMLKYTVGLGVNNYKKILVDE